MVERAAAGQRSKQAKVEPRVVAQPCTLAEQAAGEQLPRQGSSAGKAGVLCCIGKNGPCSSGSCVGQWA